MYGVGRNLSLSLFTLHYQYLVGAEMPSATETKDFKPLRKLIRPLDAFDQLVQDLSRVLGPSSGLDSADVDPTCLEDLMRNYTSSELEWKRYAFRDPSQSFTRNLVNEGNEKSNLVRVTHEWSRPSADCRP